MIGCGCEAGPVRRFRVPKLPVTVCGKSAFVIWIRVFPGKICENHNGRF